VTSFVRQCCWLLAASLLLACSRRSMDSHGHDHGDDHGHGAPEAEGPEPLSITKWTAKHELFVEFPAPSPGKPIAYHAHVTKLEGFQALNEGTFTVRYKTNSAVAAEAKISGVKRPGIFALEGAAPKAGTYTLEMVVQYGSVTDVFDCGSISLQDGAPSAKPEAASAAITFLKESQWKIPFGTAWAEEHLVAKEVELPAVVEPAGTDQLVIGAPTGGRFFHNPKLGLAEGRQSARSARAISSARSCPT
jgi:membrane fusion protein, heavy metal efflux system